MFTPRGCDFPKGSATSGVGRRERSQTQGVAQVHPVGGRRETLQTSSMRQYHSLRELDLRALQPSARLCSRRWNPDGAGTGRRQKLDCRRIVQPEPILRQRQPRRLQLADPGDRAGRSLSGLLAQHHNPRHFEPAASRGLARYRDRQAPPVQWPAAVAAAAADADRGPCPRPCLRVPSPIRLGTQVRRS